MLIIGYGCRVAFNSCASYDISVVFSCIPLSVLRAVRQALYFTVCGYHLILDF